ncbi:MAG TPA: tetratricopeptide repeat protein [Blastocatellia bacterium]|jgi:tetratricopeptide (TPR) repeat protein|nr:tetratricopeptide repeat protein [Blastocatellia bacterium]
MDDNTKTEDIPRLISLDAGIGRMPFGRDEMLTEEQAGRKRKALVYFQLAYKAQMGGELDEAVDLYRRSIEEYSTAEAHTFLGWTYSFMGLTDEAIEECRLAIEVDPDFGNPYNDIGAYLIEKKEYAAAIIWLEKAKESRRYEAVFYPYFNLGRVYEARREFFAALREYKAAMELNPDYTLAVRAFRRVQSLLN